MKRKILVLIFIIFLICLILFYNLIYKIKINNKSFNSDINIKIDQIDNNEFIKVSIYGEVLRSGEYEVPSYWTLKDLILLVGITDDAMLDSNKISLKLEDNKIYFIDKINKEDILLININTANIDELSKLPDIGMVIARRIIEYRYENPFLKIEDIMNVKGIKNATFEKIKNLITV